MPVRVRDTKDLFQRDVKVAVEAVEASPLLNGKLITGVSVPGRLRHNLGRPIKGVLLVLANTDVRVWLDGINNSQYAQLGASASEIVNLWVF